MRAHSPDGADHASVPLLIAELFITATFYAGHFLGRPTASGEIFVAHKFTAASIEYKGKPYYLDIARAGRTVRVRVNDYCPMPGRIDLSPAAAGALGVIALGKARVRVRRPPAGKQ